MYNALNTLLKPFLLTISLLLALTEALSASNSFKEEGEEELYKKGIEYRNKGKFTEAIDCFGPLAEKKYVKAQHNLALCFYNLNNEKDAHHWFKSASDQGFSPSERNLKKMNLLFLASPDEILSHISSFLPMRDLSRFALSSKRASRIFRSMITRTNFLNSENPYASDIRSIFSKVNFDRQPKAIKLALSAKVENGSIEAHFRDSGHLRDIVEEIPLIRVDDKLYFVRDNTAKDGEELTPTISTGEGLRKSYFIHVIADAPLKLSGQINVPCEIVLPLQSDFNDLNTIGKSISCANLGTYQDAHDLATTIETFNEQLYKIRTADAYHLLEDRRNARLRSPEYFPDLSALCPDCFMLSSSEIRISQKDYISAKKPLVYIARSISALDELQVNLPEFSSSICYIDPDCSQSGVYCSGPLSLQKGFEIFTESNLTMVGVMKLNDYNLKLASTHSIWMIGASLKSGGALQICSGKDFYLGGLYRFLEDNKKPKSMPQEEWNRFLEFCKERGFFE